MASLTLFMPCGDMVWRRLSENRSRKWYIRRWFLWSHILLYQHNDAIDSLWKHANRSIEGNYILHWKRFSYITGILQHGGVLVLQLSNMCFFAYFLFGLCSKYLILFVRNIWYYSRISCDLKLPNWSSCNFPCLSNLHEVFKRVIAGGHAILGKSMAVFHGT